jgi:hypothetical protein
MKTMIEELELEEPTVLESPAVKRGEKLPPHGLWYDRDA